MLQDLTERDDAGADADDLLEYAQREYGYTSTSLAIRTAVTRYTAGI